MTHEETRRIIPGADTAVLFVHGIVGTPNQFRERIALEPMVPENWSVYNLCLPGHGKTVPDFGKSSMKAWKNHVEQAFLELAEQHERVIIVGHSMGTLFAIQLALRNPGKISDLFLLAVPMRPYVGLQIINSSLRLVFNAIREDHPMEASIVAACGSTPTKKVWQYLTWIPRFVELFVEVRETEKLLPKLIVPSVAFQSAKDELVMRASYAALLRGGMKNVHMLPDSGHFYYPPKDKEQICTAFTEMIKKKA